ncbi:MAG: hypothetical protein IPI33_09280 [Dehalococcoidia bacterium]|nr:hypothetical protein [Dehalococcoidia bacterium]
MGLPPERVTALVGLNTPYGPPSNARPTESLRDFHGQTDRTFYMRYFLAPGVAEAELEADVATTFKKIFLPYTRAADFTTFTMVEAGGGTGSSIMRGITNTDSGPARSSPMKSAEYVKEYCGRVPRRVELVPGSGQERG